MALKKEIPTYNTPVISPAFERGSFENRSAMNFLPRFSFSFESMRRFFSPPKGNKRLIFEMEIPFVKMIVEEQQRRQWVFRETREFKPVDVQSDWRLEFSSWLKEQIYEFKNELAEQPRVVWLGNGLSVFRTNTPSIPRAQWKEQFIWQAAEKLPFAVEEAEIFYEKDSEGVCVVASEVARIEKIFSVFHEQGVYVSLLTPLALSYQESFQGAQIHLKGCVMVAHLGEMQSSLIIFKDGRFCWARDLSLGFHHLADAMSGTLVTEDKQEIFTYAEAVSFLRTSGLPTPDLMSGIENPKGSQLAGRVRPVFEKLTYEIKNSIAQFHLDYPALLVEKILLSGKWNGTHGLESYIQGQMLLPTEPLSHKVNVDFPLDVFASHGAGSINLGGMNATPVQDRWACQLMNWKIWLVRLTAAVSILILFSILLLAGQGAHILWEKNALRKDLNRLISDPEKIEASEQLYKAIEEREKSLALWIPSQPDWGRALRVLSRMVPSPMVLTRISYERKTRKVILKGWIESSKQNQDRLIADFLNELNQTGNFKNSTLESRSNENEELDAVTFTIQTEMAL